MSILTAVARRITPNFLVPALNAKRYGDLTGALNGALVSIPQNLAFGLLVGGALGPGWSGAGVLAVLYGAVVAGLVPAVFGGNPLLVVGSRAPTIVIFAALVSRLMHAKALAGIADPAPVALALACATGAVAGALQVIFAALRLAALARFIPFPVVAGFINSSAIAIILSQLSGAAGIPKTVGFGSAVTDVMAIHWPVLALSAMTVAIMVTLSRWARAVPAGLIAVVSASLIFHCLAIFGLGATLGGTLPPVPDHPAIRFVGDTAARLLAGPSAPELIGVMAPAALSIAVLATLDTLLSVSAVDALTLRRSNSGRQLLAEGISNLIAGLFSMPPGSSGMTRTQAGLRGGVNSVRGPILIALITLAVALSMGPMVHYLPAAVMAGLLIGQSIETLDRWTFALLRRSLSGSLSLAAMGDLLTVIVVVATTVFSSLIEAVGVGVCLSVLSFVVQMARSPIRRCYRATAVIPRIHGDRPRRHFIEQFGHKIAVIELEGALFFGSIAAVETRIEALIAEGTAHVVLDFKRVTDIDATGTRSLERLDAKLARFGGMLVIGYVERERRRRNVLRATPDLRRQPSRRAIWQKFDYFGAIAVLGEDRFLADLDHAIALCEQSLAAQVRLEGGNQSPPETTGVDILGGLRADQAKALRGYLSRQSFTAGETIFAQGDPADGIFFISRGRVEVAIDLPGTDRKMRVQILTAGSVFGEMAVIDPKPRSAAIITLEATRCRYLSIAELHRLQRDHPDIAFALMTNVARLFAERLRATNAMMAEMEV